MGRKGNGNLEKDHKMGKIATLYKDSGYNRQLTSHDEQSILINKMTFNKINLVLRKLEKTLNEV